MNRKIPMTDDIDLAAFLEGRLGGDAAAGLERALGRDRQTQMELELLRRIRTDEGPVPELPGHLVRSAIDIYPKQEGRDDLVLSFLRGVLSVVRSASSVSLSTPLTAAVRTDGSAGVSFLTMTKTFNRAIVAVHVEGTGDEFCSFTVQATERGAGQPLRNSRIELASGRRELASLPLEDGRALFEQVRPGRYELIVRKNDAVLGIMSVKIES